MRRRSFILGVLMVMLGFAAQAQVYEVYRQGFEQGEASNYTITSGSAATQSTLQFGGVKALEISHNNQMAVITLDTIDMTMYSSLSYFTLEFAHINNVSPFNCASTEQVAMVEVKLPSSSNWTRLTSLYYDVTESYSPYFKGIGYFCNEAYAGWNQAIMSNDQWKTERFNLDRLFTNTAAAMRKLQVRLTLYPKTNTVIAGNQSWWLDDIVVRASPQPMVRPTIQMLQYPDLLDYPSSRGANVKIAVKAGNGTLLINPDSVYIQYFVGTDSNTIHKHTMQPIAGTTDKYRFTIPFEGYDTLMHFRVVAKDASTNENTRTMPKGNGAWYNYRCVRGYGNTANMGAITNEALQFYPFPTEAVAKSEFIVDSATLASVGFKAGRVTKLDFIIKSGLQNSAQTRNNVQIRMKNVNTNFKTATDLSFSSDMQVVYDGNLTFPITVDGNPCQITLQDTFCYAGKDLIIQCIQNNGTDLFTPISLVGMTVANNDKKTIYSADLEFMGFNPYTSPQYKTAQYEDSRRPNLGFTMLPNPILLFDAGVSAITHPSADNAAQAGMNETVTVTFKNMGVKTITAAQITYQLDDESPITYNWTGSLNSGQTTSVTLTTTQQFSVGYHSMKAWVEDTLTATGGRYRDHEPYNDTAWVEFISCDGAMNGIRQIGGENADFAGMEEFLFALSSCGINGPLTVKLAGGEYDAMVMPIFDGGSLVNYIQFEPLNADEAVVFVDSTTTNEVLVDLQTASFVRFKDITFKKQTNSANYNYLVKLGSTSNHCQFLDCQFINEHDNMPEAMIEAGDADNLLVEGCSFKGGNRGVQLIGATPTNCANNNKVKHSEFENQGLYAVYAQNQQNVEIDSNYMKDITINSGYAILLQNVKGSSTVTRNKVYTSHGAAAIGVSGMEGTASSYGIVANNMIVEEDDGVAINIVAPLNVQSAKYVKFVYNSTQMNAPTRVGAASASFGGISLQHCIIQNNAFVTIDSMNFAVNYNPGTATNNTIGNNIYFTNAPVLNRYKTVSCADLAAWQVQVPTDVQSQSVNPGFLNGELVDLRTFSQTIKHIATPIAEVTIDMFGSPRHASTPCVGAFEFAVLNYDFQILSVEEPFAEYCGHPGTTPLRLKIYNWGSSNYTASAGSLKIHYQYGPLNNPTTGVASITQMINSEDTTDVNTGLQLTLPSLVGRYDAIYPIKLWIESALDPNNTNDTILYNVRINYVSPAMSTVTKNVPYNTSASISIGSSDGVEDWNVSTFWGSSKLSTVYWFESADSEDTLHRGSTFTTDVLLNDTVFYVNQHRELGLIRISEVMMDNSATADGQMPVRPIWMNASTKVAVELTNVGDYPADLEGDTLMITSNESRFRNKVFKFPQSLIIQPGASVVVQFRTGIHTSDSTVTLSSNINLTTSPVDKNIAVVYYHDGAIVDAVATNDMTTQNQWNQLHVPTHVWAGEGIDVSSTTAGIRRIGWPGTGNLAQDARDWWECHDNNSPLTMGVTNPNLIRYEDNGCSSPRSEVRVTVTNVPSVDLAIELEPMEEGCGLESETVSAVVRNYGIQDCASATIHFSVGGTLVGTETVTNLDAGVSKVVNFTSLVNMHVAQDSLFSIKAWIDKNASDYSALNDTTTMEVMSLKTPDAPNVAPISINYASVATLQPTTPTEDNLIWYNKNMEVLDTAAVYVTEPIYAEDTFYVKGLVSQLQSVELGTGTATTANNEKSSPYANYYKNYKTQYIYTAEDLQGIGMIPGEIKSISFDLADVGVTGDVTFSSYTITMGHTDKETFINSTAWENPDVEVYSSDNFTFSSANEGWMKHTFTTPFEWDGQSNIVVQICRTLQTANRKSVKARYTTKANSTLSLTDDRNAVCDDTRSGSRGSKRPNVQFEVVKYGCEGPITEIPIALVGVPDVDGYLAWDAQVDNMILSTCNPIALPISVRNMGRNALTNYSITYYVDDNLIGTVPGNTNLALGAQLTTNLPAYTFTPGRHKVKAILSVPNDSFNTNDTIERVFPIRFCGGTYTIGTGMDYENIATALDTLNIVGMDGSLIFNISAGTYLGQAEFGVINGASANHTITFQSASGNADDVILKAYPTTTNNYVVNINGSQYLTLKNLSLVSDVTAASQKEASVLSLSNCSNITVDNCKIKVPSDVSKNAAAKGVIIKDGVSQVTLMNNQIDSGYYAIASDLSEGAHSDHITISGNIINGFYKNGVSIRNISDVTLLSNSIKSGATSNNKPLIGVYVADHTGLLSIEKNNVVLSDDYTGGKRGIVLTSITGTRINRGRIINNMVALTGRGVAGLLSSGILVDSASTYVNIYYNSIRLETGPNATTTRALSIGDRKDDCTNINVRDNILSNFSKGYAYYVKTSQSIATSDYNAIYSNAEGANAHFAYWGGDDYATFNALKAASNKDVNSVGGDDYLPVFVSPIDLHMAIGQYSALADYNADVIDDIDGTVRPQIPSPTIGAHEYSRPMKDISIVAVIEPRMPEGRNDHPNIENRPIRVITKLFNNGTVTERNVTWYAELLAEGQTLRSTTRTIASLAPRQYYVDTTYINTVLGIVDTQEVAIHVTCAGDLNLDNNDTIVNVFLDPAYNLQVTNVDVSVTRNGSCAPENTNAEVYITIKNVGLDTFKTNMPITFGYNFEGPRGSAINNTLPHNVTEVQNLTTFLPPNASREIVLTTRADIYPHGLDSNFSLEVIGWVYFQYDIYNTNDTSSVRRVNSYYTPLPPVGEDVHIPYGTWDTLWASQRNNFVVEWYRDSTDEMSRFNLKNNYDKSRSWEDTPQYFDDSTYYLRTTSNKGCKSHFSKINVYVNPLVAYDAAVEQILSPRKEGHVYNEKDTVKVRIINYGTQSISNIPVTYLYTKNDRAHQEIQRVSETCTATIAPGQTYDYEFDSLLVITTPVTQASYNIRAWTDLPNEMTRLNDTMRAEFIFNTLQENPTPDYSTIEVSADGLDITRVSFNTMHNELHPLGYTYQNFGTYLNPEVPALHLKRGTKDTIIVGCVNNQNLADINTVARLAVWIDYNRDGVFIDSIPATNPTVILERVADTSLKANGEVKVPITIPEGASYGYMRMRVMIAADDCERLLPWGYIKRDSDGNLERVTKISSGQVHDYLLYIDEVSPTVDVALTRVASPYQHKVDTSTYNIQVVMVNKGTSELTSADINCRFVGPLGFKDTTFNWTGTLASGNSTIVTLPSYRFNEGTTIVSASVSVAGDIDPLNDTLIHEYHRFHIVTLPIMDSFETLDMWYAPQGKTQYTKNYWQLGKPNKRLYIRNTTSGEHAWVTDLVNDIKTGKYGNRSELYTPIIDISQIRPDSLIFMLSQVLSNDSYLSVEYYDWQGLWTKVSPTGNLELNSWYDSEAGFTGNSHGGYNKKIFPLSNIVGNIPQYAQFRFVYVTPPSTPYAEFGEGCAIDDLKICRAPRPVDVGVIDIIEPTAPKYGETIHPTVVMKNYGTDTVNQVNLAYTTYGSNMAKQGRWNGTLVPGDTAHYTFGSSFIVGSNFPDTFSIVAYTLMSADLYWDNDSTMKDFYLTPLEHDLNIEGFVSPLDRVVAGDSLDITVRMRNYGTEPINSVTMTYIFNYGDPVTEEVDLTQYFGEEGLGSKEYFNYTFKKKVRSSLGYMAITAYGKGENDMYVYNDTISKKIEGITSITDLVATGMIVDKKAFDSVWFAITIDNQGSRAVNDFEVGFWYDNDTSTMVKNIYHAAEPLASLATVSYTFDKPFAHRTQDWSHVCGYVRAIGDNDRSNDTTCNIVNQFVDLKLIRVEVEENKEEDCAVRFVLENIGNLTLTKESTFKATINGVTIKNKIDKHFVPGRVYRTEMVDRIPKSATREYVGIGEIIQVRDTIKDNNQTSVVKVLNYFEDVPIADANSGVVLEQNYPNPFEQTTAIEFVIPEGGEVLFYVVDVMGRIQYQTSNMYDNGRHVINFDASSLASGTYYYGIVYKGERMMRKMIIR